MRNIVNILGALLLTATTAGCSAAYQSSAGYANDDLYAYHDRAQIAREQKAKADAEKAAAEARRAEWEARIAEAEAAAAENRYYEYNSGNSYESVLADTYESAYARRLRGFESPTYRMPSSYYNYRYGSAFTYVSAYDPAFYNVIVMGDQVWVEPKYITSMFGTWGTVVSANPWYYGWNRAWGPTFSFGSWGWSFGWNSWYSPWLRPWDPWYPWYNSWYGYGWGWGHGWGHGYRPPHHHYHYSPLYWNGGGGHYHYSYNPNRPNYVHRPGNNDYYHDFRTPTYGGSSRPVINGTTNSGNGNWSSGVMQGSGNRRQPSTSRNEGAVVNDRRNNPSGSSSGSSWNSNRTNSRRSSSSGSSPSYNSGSSRGGGYTGGGYTGGGSSGGSSSRGGSVTGSSSRGR